MDPQSLAIDTTRAAIQERRTTAFALAEDFYLRIEKQDPLIGAYLTLSKERALAKARRSTRSPPKVRSCRRSAAFRLPSRT